MSRRVFLWGIVLAPALMLFLIGAILCAAFAVKHIMADGEAFAKAGEVLQALARDVYERQRAIWQAQRECIEFDAVLLYKPKTGKCIFRNLEFSTVLTFDGRGFRQKGSLPYQGKNESSGRVIVLGDSQAMGWGVQDEETFASVLATEYSLDAFNLGVSSYGTARELLRLRKEFELRSGDVVFIQYHPNDLSENRAFLKQERMPARSPADLDRLSHTAQEYGVFQVSASIAFIMKGRVMKRLLSNGEDEVFSGAIHTDTFLSVLDRFPELKQVRVVVCEVDNFGRDESFADDLDRRRKDGITVLRPRWEATDFFRLDGHMNARGHRKLAGMIAEVVSSGQAGRASDRGQGR